jgi:F-type H+-transporting ATPase subunit b
MEPLFLLQSLPPERLFAIDEQTLRQMVFILINAAVLAFVLSKLLYAPVLKILTDRRERIRADIETAEESKAEALKLKAEYEQKMKDITAEKNEILEAANKLASEKSRNREAAAKSEAEAIRTRAKKDIELEKERAKGEMKQEIIDISSLMVTKFLNRTIDADVHEQLFNEAMADLEEWRGTAKQSLCNCDI